MGWMGHSRAWARNRIAPRAAGRTAIAVAALALLLPVLPGCAGILSTSSSSPQASPARASASQAQAGGGSTQAASGVTLLQQGDVSAKPPPGFSCPTKSLRGCFSESSMATYFDFVLPIVDKFFETTWRSLPLPAHVYFIADGARTREACLDQTGSHLADDMSYAYCPADDNVYIGQHIAYELYSLAGDVAPATGIAHEFGHNVQQHTGVPDPQTDAETLVHENQADCVSGAWLGYANNQHLLEQGDVPAIERYLELIASSESDPNRTHGDFAERGQSVQVGGEKGISACNAFYPGTPIIGQ
jgi:Putative neutral zinc metallopeptidase